MRRLYFLAVVASVVPPVAAQRYLVVEKVPPRVHRVDVQAGALFEYDWIDPSADGANQALDAARVGTEIWVSASNGVYRYDGATLALTGTIPSSGVPRRGVQGVSDGAWLSRESGTLEKFDFAGNPLVTVTAPGALDVLLFNGELLVPNSQSDTIDRYDLAGQPLGPIGPAGLGLGFNFNSFGHLGIRPSTGNLLLAEVARIFEVDPATGLLIGDYQAGLFEQSSVELADGRLLVFNINNATTYDTNLLPPIGPSIPTTANRNFGFASPYDVGHPVLRRFCSAAPNSAGGGAQIAARGTTRLADGSLWLDAFGGPGGELGLFVYGQVGAALPFGDGQLCLSAAGPGIVRTATLGAFGSGGDREHVELPYGAFPANAPVLAGSDWSFQYLYRDAASLGAGFNATDAIRLVFE